MEYLKTKPYAYGEMYLPHDAQNKSFQTGKSTRELMIAHGAATRLLPNLSVQDGIQGVRFTLENTFFNTDNADVRMGLNALKIYQREWDDKKKMFKEAPLHDWSSNPADAFRSLSMAINPSAARKSEEVANKLRVNPTRLSVVSTALNLENLHADRAASLGSNRRI
jgi:hypothetical protein